ncbi:MAG: hypothetical protein ACXVFN_13585 [Solirubrobacteraceae bacterium]
MSIGPAQLLAELNLPLGLESRQPIVARYAETLEPTYNFVIAARTDPSAESGYASFATFNLLCSSLSDLLAGGHLIDHCYISQAYSVMRPALDACDLLELFAQDPSEAETWARTDKPHIDFSPANVREKLGQARHDPVHGHFSESGSHPRFAGSNLRGVMRVNPDDETDRTAMLRIGSTFPEHPATLIAWLFAFNTVISVASKARHLVLVSDEATSIAQWLEAFHQTLDAASQGVTLVLTELGEDPQEMHDHYAEMRDNVASWLIEPDNQS